MARRWGDGVPPPGISRGVEVTASICLWGCPSPPDSKPPGVGVQTPGWDGQAGGKGPQSPCVLLAAWLVAFPPAAPSGHRLHDPLAPLLVLSFLWTWAGACLLFLLDTGKTVKHEGQERPEALGSDSPPAGA